AERLRRRRIEAGESGMTEVGDDVAVEVRDRTVWIDHGLNMEIAEERVEVVIAARFIGEQIRPAVAVAAKRTTLCAMNGDALKIGDRLVEPASIVGNDPFRRSWPEHRVYIGGDAFEFDVCGRERADVAACAGPRHPRRRRNLALLVCHLHVAVGGLPGPV